jgi:hypothetical protein
MPHDGLVVFSVFMVACPRQTPKSPRTGDYIKPEADSLAEYRLRVEHRHDLQEEVAIKQ